MVMKGVRSPWDVRKVGVVDGIMRDYARVVEYCQTHDVSEHMMYQSERFLDGAWHIYQDYVIDRIPVDLTGKVVVDFGCKFGHLTPLLVAANVTSIFNIDVVDEYLRFGEEVFGKMYPNVSFVKSDQGFIPLQPGTVHVVIMNEVISHISGSLLETLYMEIGRILNVGGLVFISDGNNLSYPGYFEQRLIPLYDLWENGPDGSKTDSDTVTKSYVTRRKETIQERYPDLEQERADYLARNTSGLFGDYLLKTIDRYVETGDLIRRPYRRRICPTNPDQSGAVMERGFDPLEVDLALRRHGFEAFQIFPKPAMGGEGMINRAKDVYRLVRHYFARIVRPRRQRGQSENFQITGIKKY
ncbi:MAG: class I SAM-dependent methyltransferase [Candidatus Binatia bacterium]